MPRGFVRNVGEGDRRWFLGGGVHDWKATSMETGGSLFVFEDTIDSGKVTPLHMHPDADEAGYILEGEIELLSDGEISNIRAGGFFFTPRGIQHAFRGIAPHTRLLSIQTPGQGDAFYLRAAEPLSAGQSTGEVNFDEVKRVAMETKTTVILGPPPFASIPS